MSYWTPAEMNPPPLPPCGFPKPDVVLLLLWVPSPPLPAAYALPEVKVRAVTNAASTVSGLDKQVTVGIPSLPGSTSSWP
jgi:hypothetical protein